MNKIRPTMQNDLKFVQMRRMMVIGTVSVYLSVWCYPGCVIICVAISWLHPILGIYFELLV